MADAAVEFLLENLKELIVYNVNLIVGVKEEVDALYKELSLFNAFLKQATKKHNRNDLLREIMSQVREVVYEAEDIIDTYVYNVAAHEKSRRNLGTKIASKFGQGKKLRSVGKQIEAVKTKIKDLHEKGPVVEEENVVGFKNKAEKVLKLVKSESEELEVVSIVGMPGLGKTTLARMIYRDPAIQYEFYNRAWVYVSQECNRKDVFLKILRQIDSVTDGMKQMDGEELALELRNVLKNEKYIIFMDDVWSEEDWNGLKVAFPDNKKGSRILLTTRMAMVARHAKRRLEPYEMDILDDDHSWELLKWKALQSKECPLDLEPDGKHIAKECKGLPLAIVIVGGILRENNNANHWWKKVAKSVDDYIVNDRVKTMEKFIEMSFTHLPFYLRACFLYFGIFPEDFQIPVWKLACIWIAEGFIEEQGDKSLEDIAEEHLEDLVNRNLVMIGERRLNGKIKTCHVHDMLLAFCRNQATEENLFHEIKQFDPSKYSPSDLNWQKHRRLCIHSNVERYLSCKPVGPHVRSFLCFYANDFKLDPSLISSIPKEFKLLRVLDGKPMVFPRFSMETTQLIHLRYLVLSCQSHILPETFSNLWNLQTLIVYTWSRTFEIKANIWKMKKLRHIKTNTSTSTSLPPPSLIKEGKEAEDSSGNGNVIALSTISPDSCTQEIFAMVPNLKKLGIRGQIAQVFNSFDCVKALKHLENLKLLNDVFLESAAKGKIVRLPQKDKFPEFLNKLTLENTLLDWKHMSTLGKLEFLEILKLKDNAFDGLSWEVEDGGFQVLKVLHIGKTSLVTWGASSHHFPMLKSLYLKHCSDLKAVPFGLADVMSLEIIDLHRTTNSAAISAQEIQKHKKDKKTNNGREFKLSIFPPDHGQDLKDNSTGNKSKDV